VNKAEDNIRELNVTFTYRHKGGDDVKQYYRISWFYDFVNYSIKYLDNKSFFKFRNL
jgi:hypothetical protein